MDFGIRGKIAFVAGGSQGIGAAVAAILADEGCRIAIVARDEGRIERAVTKLKAAGADAIGISADLATEAGVHSAMDAVRAAYGPPEIVVAQTNDMTHGNFFDISNEDYERVFRIFTISLATIARQVLPDMQKAGWGRIVHIGSAVAKEPQRDLAHITHNTIRSSTTSLMKSLADEFSRFGITFNSIAPGYTMTDTMRNYFETKYGVSEDAIAEWVHETRGVPAERHGTPEEVGSVIAFLCSQQAGYVTGEWITVDGGWHRSAV
jgi:3-oxoacyl-[acyl-carrier protein] reductase